MLGAITSSQGRFNWEELPRLTLSLPSKRTVVVGVVATALLCVIQPLTQWSLLVNAALVIGAIALSILRRTQPKIKREEPLEKISPTQLEQEQSLFAQELELFALQEETNGLSVDQLTLQKEELQKKIQQAEVEIPHLVAAHEAALTEASLLQEKFKLQAKLQKQLDLTIELRETDHKLQYIDDPLFEEEGETDLKALEDISKWLSSSLGEAREREKIRLKKRTEELLVELSSCPEMSEEVLAQKLGEVAREIGRLKELHENPLLLTLQHALQKDKEALEEAEYKLSRLALLQEKTARYTGLCTSIGKTASSYIR
jgi:hypothetical protein